MAGPVPSPSARSIRGFDRKANRRRSFGIWAGGVLAFGFAAAFSGSIGLSPWGVLASLVVWLWIADRWMRRPGGVPCLTWHSVSRDAAWLPWADETSVRPETLDRQLGLLSRMGCEAMDTVDFVNRRRQGAPVPEGTVLLHFDDGYLDNWIAAAPLLRRHGARATIFVSLDFLAPDRPLPASLDDTDTPPRWDGYLSWQELAALDAGAFGGVFDVQPHGVDHGRVPTGPEIVDKLTASNWRRLAWVQWSAMPGNKHDWYLAGTPPAVPLGSAVPQSEAALAARAWTGAGLESEEAYENRVRGELRACVQAFRNRLGKEPSLFCWPQNRSSPAGRRIALEEGFIATTAGRGANRPEEDPAILGRVHVGERVAGFDWPWLDDLVFRATVRCFQGNSYWYLPILAARVLKTLGRGLATARGGQARRSEVAL